MLDSRAMPGRRFKASGPNIPDEDRHTVKLCLRCNPEIAAQVRALCAAKGVTLAQVLAAGIAALAKETQPTENPSE